MEYEDLRRRMRDSDPRDASDVPAAANDVPSPSHHSPPSLAPSAPPVAASADAVSETGPATPPRAWKTADAGGEPRLPRISPPVLAAPRTGGQTLVYATFGILVLAAVVFAFAAGSYYVMPRAFPFVPTDVQIALLERRTLATLVLLGFVALVLVLYSVLVFGAMRSLMRESALAEASLRAAEHGLNSRLDTLGGTLAARAGTMSESAALVEEAARAALAALGSAASAPPAPPPVQQVQVLPQPADEERWRQVVLTLGHLAEALERRDAGAAPATLSDESIAPLVARLSGLDERLEALLAALPARDGGEDRTMGPRMTALAATIDGLAERVGPSLDAIQAAVDALGARPDVDLSRVHEDLSALKRDLGIVRLDVAAAAGGLSPMPPLLDEIRRGIELVTQRLARTEEVGVSARGAIEEAFAALQTRIASFDDAFGPAAAALARLDDIGDRMASENRQTRLATDAIGPQMRSQEAALDIVRAQGERLLAAIEGLSSEIGRARGGTGQGADGLDRLEGMLADLQASVGARLDAIEAGKARFS